MNVIELTTFVVIGTDYKGRFDTDYKGRFDTRDITTFVVIGTDYKGRFDTRDILPLGLMLNYYHIKLYRVHLTT